MADVQLTVHASKRFLSQVRKQSPLLKRQTLVTINELVERYLHEAPLRSRQVRRVAGITQPVWRAKLNKSNRLLYHWDKRLTLLDVGHHDITEQYSDEQCRRDLRSAKRADELLSRAARAVEDSRFHEEASTALPQFADGENRREWIYYLDDEQAAICDSLLASALETPRRRKAAVHLVMGGPGTGKTTILVWLLDQLRDASGIEVRLRVSDAIRDYLTAHLPFDLEPYLYRPGEDGGVGARVLLIDDPDSLAIVERHCNLAEMARYQKVIAAFDPLQLTSSITDEQCAEFTRRFRANEHHLGSCYRQRRNVGVAAQRVAARIAESTAFADAGNIAGYRQSRSGLTELANNIAFRNPSGYVKKYPETRKADVQLELERIHSRELWEHWPFLLVACEDGAEHAAEQVLRSVPARLYRKPLDLKLIRKVGLNDVGEIKGTEFQHALVFITRHLFHDIENGFSGTGRRVYEARRLLRIPFSRARDSLVTFVV